MKTTQSTTVSLRTNRRDRSARKSALRRGILAASIAALTGLAAPLASHAATFSYDSGDATVNWGAVNNWNPNGAPVNGSDLVFSVHTGGGATRQATNNILTDVQSITFGGQIFLLNGNPITLGSGGITNNSASTQTISFTGTGVTLGAAQTWTAATGNLNVNSAVNLGAFGLIVTGASNTTLSGVVSSSAGSSLTKNGNGTLNWNNAGLVGGM